MRCEALHFSALHFSSPTRVFLMRCEAQHFCSPSRVFFVFYFLDVRIKSCDFASRWSRERKIRKYSFKREMKVSRSNPYHPFSDVLYDVPFVYRKSDKKTNLRVFLLKIIKTRKVRRHSRRTTDFYLLQLYKQLIIDNESDK